MNLIIGHDPLATFKSASIIYTDTLRVHGLCTKRLTSFSTLPFICHAFLKEINITHQEVILHM